MPSSYPTALVDQRLAELYERHRQLDSDRVARYYEPGRGYYRPDAAGDERDYFGVAFAEQSGEIHVAGDCDRPFALQSLSKVFVYGLALEDNGRETVLEHVGVEPSGEAFYSIEFDERHHRPHNPMVNAGALVTSALVQGADAEDRLDRVLHKLRLYAGNDDLAVDQDVFEREMRAADRNRAIAYLMRSQQMLSGDVEAILALYLQQCSVTVTCRDVAVMAATLANGGVNPVTGARALPRANVRDVLSVMYTCGMYDAAGQWAYEIGVPAKSGVSGGILAAIPDKLGVGVFSPGLDEYGNSVRGVNVCLEVSERLGLHVFATEGEDAMLGAGADGGSSA
jgi:glutaminase